MRLKVFVLTVGEEVVHDAITMFHFHTPIPYDLTIWYDACGRGVDWKFLDSLFKHTDDVILSTKDKTISAAMGFASVFTGYEWMLMMSADVFPRPDYFGRMVSAIGNVPKVGMVGEAWRGDIDGDYEVSNFEKGIDAFWMLSKEAVNSVGGFSPSFNGKGPGHFEFQRRLVANGWNFVAMDGLCDHGGQKHEGRDRDKGWKKAVQEDDVALMRAAMRGYKHYNWWSNAN